MLNIVLEFGGDAVIDHWILTTQSVILFIFVTYFFLLQGNTLVRSM